MHPHARRITVAALIASAALIARARTVVTLNGDGSVIVTRDAPSTGPVTLPDALTPPTPTQPAPTSQPAPWVTIVPPPATAPATPGPVTAARRSLLGVNLEPPVDYSRSHVYINAARLAPSMDLDPSHGDNSAPRGANGWPVGDWGLIVIRQAAQSDSGDYLVVFGGRCRSITAVGVPSISPAAYDSAAEVTRGVIHFDNALKRQNFLIRFNGVSSPCRFAKVIRPGYTDADEAAKVFSDEFLGMLRALRPGVIRGMDFLRTNHSPLAHWPDRPTQASPSYSAGGPVEDLVDICNAVGSDLWLNVPHEADADFRSRLAALVAGRLRPDLSVYVEYSNEIWNTQFKQSQQNQDAVLRDRAAGVPYDAVPSVAGWQRTAREITLLGDVFRAAFVAAGRPASQVRPILCGQGAAPQTLSVGLKYIADHFGRPADKLYGIATAPYSAITPDLPLTDWHLQVLKADKSLQRNAIARQYGLKAMVYECGVDLDGSELPAATQVAGQSDARMQPLVYAYLEGHLVEPDLSGPACWFNVCSWPRAKRVYGLTDDVFDLDQPKFRAAAAWSAAHQR